MFLYGISNRPSDTPCPPDPRSPLVRNALRGFAPCLTLRPDVPRFIDAGITGMLSRRRTDADQSELATHLVPHSWSAVFARYESIYREPRLRAILSP